jgi:hypothetical protein
MTVRLKTITNTSWLVIGDSEDVRLGLLTESRQKYILMIKGEKKHFLDRKEVNKYFNENVFENLIEPEVEDDIKKDCFINGFPIDFNKPIEVIIKGNKLPLYSKKASSEVYYSAGWYCLNFPKNWMQAFCPKLSTLEEYQYAGPFKTELEMRSQLVKLRKEKNKNGSNLPTE